MKSAITNTPWSQILGLQVTSFLNDRKIIEYCGELHSITQSTTQPFKGLTVLGGFLAHAIRLSARTL